MKFRNTLMAIGLVLALPGLASAATINFAEGTLVGSAYVEDGLMFDPARIVTGSGNGNCGYLGGGSCLAFNTGETTTMTTSPVGGMFDLVSLTFVLVGQTAELSVMNFSVDPAGSLLVNFDVGGTNIPGTTIQHNTAYTYYFNGSANGLTEILFDNTGTGNVRLGNIVANVVPPATIPVPAAGFLLFGALGGLAALRRRRKAA